MTNTSGKARHRLSVPLRTTVPVTPLTESQRHVLHEVADLLIPAQGANPAACEAPDYDDWLDLCLAARQADLGLLSATLDELGRSSGEDLASALRELHANDSSGGFHLLSSVVAGAYLAGPSIRQLIGYPGQRREPAKIDDAANELADGILDPVLERGHIYVSAAGE